MFRASFFFVPTYCLLPRNYNFSVLSNNLEHLCVPSILNVNIIRIGAHKTIFRGGINRFLKF